MGSNKNKKATYTEIANISGVSIATVSRVLNNRQHVKAETSQKVIGAMESLGYNTTELIAKPTPPNNRLIIFNIPALENPFYSEIANGAKTAAIRHGYHLLINEEHINLGQIDPLLHLVKNLNAAGMIIVNHVVTELLDKLNSTLPIVQCCEYNDDADMPFVSIDDISTSIKMMEYILSTGRRKIALMNGPTQYKYARHRLDGYLSTLKNNNIPVEQNWIISLPEVNYNMAVSASYQLLNSPNPPDVVYAVSDVFAAGVIKAATNIGLRIPQDLLVVGFDNVDISTMTTPNITTINQPKFQLGFMACELLIEKIADPNTPVRKMFLEAELIIRESSTIQSPMKKITKP